MKKHPSVTLLVSMAAVLVLLLSLPLSNVRAEAFEPEGETETMYVTNCESWVSLRRLPDTGSERIMTVPLGARVEGRYYNEDFSECVYQGEKGYILSCYLAREGSGNDEPASDIQTSGEMIVLPNVNEYLTLRDASGGTITTMPPGERMLVLGWDGVSCRVQRLSTGETGYVHSAYIQAEKLDRARWPYDYAALQEDVSSLSEHEHMETETLAETADGRDVVVFRYGSEAAAHHILIQCAMHAREIMTSRLGSDLLRMLIEDYPDGIDDVCVHIVPLTNPDGQTIALYGADAIRNETLAQRIRQWIGYGNHADWKANARGVDLNRNFDAGWEDLPVRTPGSERYRGEAPHCEAESKALVEYMDRFPFDCTISIHSYGSLIYWLGAEGELRERSRSLADTVSAVTGYQPVASESNVEKGGFKDWAVEKAGIPSLTIEIGALDAMGSLEEYSGIALRFRQFIPALVEWIGKDGGRPQ